MKLSQNISSATLFHFTSELDFLLSIIEKGFQARYCSEKLPKKRIAYLTPMVCFCDIPLGSVKFHLSRYGGYGIGLKKSYLKEKGVTPLLYVHSKTPHLTVTATDKNLSDLRNSKTTPYLKQIIGYDPIFEDGTRKVLKLNKVNYSNEKEWRYIPIPSDIEFVNYTSTQQLVDKKDIKNSSSVFELLKIENFEAIEYIILSRNKDLDRFLTFLDKLSKSVSFKKEVLLSKILIQGQILRDF